MSSTKITIRIPTQLKEQLVEIKDELNLSFSCICKEAIEQYLESKKLDKLNENK